MEVASKLGMIFLICVAIGLVLVYWMEQKPMPSTAVFYEKSAPRADVKETLKQKLIFKRLLDQAIKNQSEYVLGRLNQAIKNAWLQSNFSDDRHLLSSRLNILSKELNQFICELADEICMEFGFVLAASCRISTHVLYSSGDKIFVSQITATGGWCMLHFKDGHWTDVKLAETMAEMLKNQTVASFGDGPGAYRSIILGSGLVKIYDAYDGSPMIEQVTNGNVSYLDLSIPQYGLPLYDWVVSLEVVEHIPWEYEDIFLGNVVRHAKRGLVFSWARPGQGGVGHVNERPDAHVERK